MKKSYTDFMNEISADELYEGLLAYGLFYDKLPPIFNAIDFYNYTKNNPHVFLDNEKQYVNKQYIYYESMRNINIPRQFGIPNPVVYQKLCRCLSDNWNKIKEHFKKQTLKQDYKISRVHIRKRHKSKSLFFMNYPNWNNYDTPEQDLLIGKRYIVKADISTCYPSIYTHSISWALVGKKEAKKCKNCKKEWYNQIDYYARNCKNGETHGLLIGIHASNILAEIILTVIDKHLYANGWRYIRNIDDYTCYVESTEEGRKFLTDLSNELRNFDLILNYKKIELKKLPIAATEQWVHKIHVLYVLQKEKMLELVDVSAYLNFVIELMQKNKDNSAILNYAIKTLSKKKLASNAKEYYVKTILHLSFLYPYLIPLLEEQVFKPFHVEEDQVASFSQKIFQLGYNEQNYEAICFSIYFALKYDFKLTDITAEIAIASGSCMFKLFAFLYFYTNENIKEVEKLKEHAKSLAEDDDEFNRNWLFVYEVLPQSDLKDSWKKIKKANISFIRIPISK